MVLLLGQGIISALRRCIMQRRQPQHQQRKITMTMDDDDQEEEVEHDRFRWIFFYYWTAYDFKKTNGFYDDNPDYKSCETIKKL